MGRLILTMHVSADGYMATPDNGLWPGFGWPPVVQGRLNGVYRDAESVVYGRGIYEAVVPWWLAVARGQAPDEDVGREGVEFARMLAALPRFVVSNSMPQPADGTVVIRDNAVPRIAELVATHEHDVILLAGARLAGDLLRAGLLNDIVLIVGTVLLGAGRPLLDGLTEQVQLQLIEAQAYPPSTTWLRYRVG